MLVCLILWLDRGWQTVESTLCLWALQLAGFLSVFFISYWLCYFKHTAVLLLTAISLIAFSPHSFRVATYGPIIFTWPCLSREFSNKLPGLFVYRRNKGTITAILAALFSSFIYIILGRGLLSSISTPIWWGLTEAGNGADTGCCPTSLSLKRTISIYWTGINRWRRRMMRPSDHWVISILVSLDSKRVGIFLIFISSAVRGRGENISVRIWLQFLPLSETLHSSGI